MEILERALSETRETTNYYYSRLIIIHVTPVNGLNLEQARLVTSCAPIVPLIGECSSIRLEFIEIQTETKAETEAKCKTGFAKVSKMKKMSNKTEAGKPLFLRIRSVATIGAVVLNDTGAVSVPTTGVTTVGDYQGNGSRDMVSSDFWSCCAIQSLEVIMLRDWVC